MTNHNLNRAVVTHCPDAPIRDELIAQEAASDPDWTFTGQPPADDELALKLIRKRTSDPAATLAARVTSPAVIDAVAATEKRRKVWLALAANPHLTEFASAKLLEYAATQRYNVQEDFARQLLDPDRTRVLGDTLALLADNPWLRNVAASTGALYDLASRQLAKASLAELTAFVALEPSAKPAAAALASLLSSMRWRYRRKHLPATVVAPLFASCHAQRCNNLCNEVAAWAVRYGSAAIDGLYAKVNCPTGSTILLTHYQASGDTASAADLVDLLINDPDPKRATDRISAHGMQVWLTACAEAAAEIDAPLARALARELTSNPHSYRRSYYFPDATFTQAGAEALCVSSEWPVARYALARIANPVQRCAQLAQWVTANTTRNQEPKLTDLDTLAESPGMIEVISELPSDQFNLWALPLWRYEAYRSEQFITRSIAILDLATLTEAIESLDLASQFALANRALASPKSNQRDDLVVKLLQFAHSEFDDALRWALIDQTDATDIIELMPNRSDDTPVHLGELGRLVSRRPDVVPTLLYRVRTAYALLWVQEALDVLPFSWDDLGDVAWETLNRSLSQAFGTDKAHWTIALGLLETWSATLPELIDTTNMLV